MNCLLNVLGYAVFIPATILYKVLSIGGESSPEDGGPPKARTNAPDSAAKPRSDPFRS